MGEKGKTEKLAEQNSFSVFKTWCENIKGQKDADIESLTLTVATLTSNIDQNEIAIEENTAAINKAEEDKGHWSSDVDAATRVREIERKDFDATNKDYTESIDALARAVPVLKAQDYDRKQAGRAEAEALLQVSEARRVPSSAKQAVAAFLQSSHEPFESYEAPEANAYEFHADHIVSILEGLLSKFREQRNALAKEEDESQHSFDLLVQELTHDISEAEKAINALTKENSLLSEDTVLKKADLTDTQNTLSSDKTYLDDTVALCIAKATEYRDRQQLRTEEMEAIAKAIEIISSGTVSGTAEKYLPTDSARGEAFVQLSSVSKMESPQRRASAYLQMQGKRFGSHVLSTVASKIEASPFEKVIRMIKELVDKLTEQVNDEATQKGWCSTELSKNEQSRTTLTTDVGNLKNNIDELDASIQKLTQEVLDLGTAIEQLNAAVNEGTAQRTKDSAINAQTVEDAKAAEEAVEQALAILQEFYEKAGTATALTQQQPAPPPTWTKAYTGMQENNGGVIGMLQVILSDFMKLAADTVSQEEADQREFEVFIEDSRVAQLEKEKDINSKNTLIDKQSTHKDESEQDLRTAQKQLDAALDYFEKLKPTCINTDMSFEERQRRRDEEIQSLKEALRILNGEETS
uniref:Uncharacterized protein n=1 Tax=Noctiluca scintillans TaxID=2966 RepID=A0A7S1FBN6_NOCSC